jgi:hypothetical protein
MDENMKDQLVTKETAVLARARGFKSPYTENCWVESRDPNWNGRNMKRTDIPYIAEGCDIICQPTQTELHRWLRETQEILVVPLYSYNDNPRWTVHVENILDMVEDQNSVLISGIDFLPALYCTYEDAMEMGLEIALQIIKL